MVIAGRRLSCQTRLLEDFPLSSSRCYSLLWLLVRACLVLHAHTFDCCVLSLRLWPLPLATTCQYQAGKVYSHSSVLGRDIKA